MFFLFINILFIKQIISAPAPDSQNNFGSATQPFIVIFLSPASLVIVFLSCLLFLYLQRGFHDFVLSLPVLFIIILSVLSLSFFLLPSSFFTSSFGSLFLFLAFCNLSFFLTFLHFFFIFSAFFSSFLVLLHLWFQIFFDLPASFIFILLSLPASLFSCIPQYVSLIFLLIYFIFF